VTKVVDGAEQQLTIVSYDYTLPMAVFVGFGLLALVFAYLLKAEDKKKGYGLEEPCHEKG
jgi:phosphotransferase system  glucose/maltose/N-acetylglucosamine-specific IIC component